MDFDNDPNVYASNSNTPAPGSVFTSGVSCPFPHTWMVAAFAVGVVVGLILAKR